MTAPAEHTDPTDGKLAEWLLEYDAALAAGKAPGQKLVGELPEEFNEAISCLNMLERLRLSDRLSEVPGSSPSDPSHDRLSWDQAGVPAQLGGYQILKLIGQGGCGVVFLAHDPALRRPVAVKIPRPE